MFSVRIFLASESSRGPFSTSSCTHLVPARHKVTLSSRKPSPMVYRGLPRCLAGFFLFSFICCFYWSDRCIVGTVFSFLNTRNNRAFCLHWEKLLKECLFRFVTRWKNQIELFHLRHFANITSALFFGLSRTTRPKQSPVQKIATCVQQLEEQLILST